MYSKVPYSKLPYSKSRDIYKFIAALQFFAHAVFVEVSKSSTLRRGVEFFVSSILLSYRFLVRTVFKVRKIVSAISVTPLWLQARSIVISVRKSCILKGEIKK